jgi:hypothetical protein
MSGQNLYEIRFRSENHGLQHRTIYFGNGPNSKAIVQFEASESNIILDAETMQVSGVIFHLNLESMRSEMVIRQTSMEISNFSGETQLSLTTFLCQMLNYDELVQFVRDWNQARSDAQATFTAATATIVPSNLGGSPGT